jgi:hypothetical protein
MRVAIIQLSDLHIRDSHNEVLGRSAKIVSAVQVVRALTEHYDIALHRRSRVLR